MFMLGEQIDVTIDDHIPTRPDGSIAFAKSVNRHEIWPMLVEKAFAKLHGCYDNIIAGFTLESFGILTGAPTEMKFHRKTPDILV